MRRWLNRAIDLLFLPGTEHLWARRLRGSVIVLVYHRVSDQPGEDFLDRGGVPRITPGELRRDLKFLLGIGARFMTCRELAEGEFPSPREIGLVVTFDDGFRDSYEMGLPVVESLGGKAVVFQCTAMLDGAQWLPEHRLYRALYEDTPGRRAIVHPELARALGLDAAETNCAHSLVNAALTEVRYTKLLSALENYEDETGSHQTAYYPDVNVLQSAIAAGHEIGSHGHWHLHRATIDSRRFEEELRTSRQQLSDLLGAAPAAFSFPFGAVRSGDEKLCARYYKQAATCERAAVFPDTNPMALGRFSWPGPARNGLRLRRWLLTGSI